MAGASRTRPLQEHLAPSINTAASPGQFMRAIPHVNSIKHTTCAQPRPALEQIVEMRYLTPTTTCAQPHPALKQIVEMRYLTPTMTPTTGRSCQQVSQVSAHEKIPTQCLDSATALGRRYAPRGPASFMIFTASAGQFEPLTSKLLVTMFAGSRILASGPLWKFRSKVFL